ncbi:hypothetical protein OBP_239 [Pseudomonas phage OBP]|uniref:hypothetical protein n=1 Tax=Pseudomonas phage OBP TaxID=1124849 RepID=UPI000240D5D3|nr:hypothetical protein OBP_239 [Pseudomonas phage OBP]AEV89676.1 hypothetical protein OBP_239 [Pseudomonas phage OBP]
MAKKVLLAVDMDDTLTETRLIILKDIYNRLIQNGRLAEATYVNQNYHISPLLWSKEMCDVVYEYVIESGDFMWCASPAKLVRDGLADLLRAFSDHQWGPYFKSVVCTHRGFHKSGLLATTDWLIRHNCDDVFSEVHALDPKEHPNKIDFLRKVYPDYEILLLDDNPFHDPHLVHPYSDEVLIVETEHALPGYVNQEKFTDLDDLKVRIIRKMFGRRGYEKLIKQYADIA